MRALPTRRNGLGRRAPGEGNQDARPCPTIWRSGDLAISRSGVELDEILEDERRPASAACLDERTAYGQLPEEHRREPELLGKGLDWRDRLLVAARQEDDSTTPLTPGSAPIVFAAR